MHTHRTRPELGECLADTALAWPAHVTDAHIHDSDDAVASALLAAGGRSLVPTPFRRFVCSATLTTNPRKLTMLGLVRPRYFTTGRGVDVASSTAVASEKRYQTPKNLAEAMIVCAADDKVFIPRRYHTLCY